MTSFRSACLLLLSLSPQLWAQSAEELLREAILNDGTLFTDTRDYTYRSRRIVTEFEKDGRSKITEDETHEHLVLYGRPYQKLIARDGIVLSEKDARKEDKKLDKQAENLRKKARKLAEEDERARQHQAEVTEDVMRAFDLKLLGIESLDGRDTWAISATPRPGFKPRTSESKLFSKISGVLWIDREEERIVRVEAHVLEKISFGWFLLQLLPDAIFEHQRIRVAEGVWLPARDVAKGEAKILGLKRVQAEVVTSYSDYRRFQTESIITVEDPN